MDFLSIRPIALVTDASSAIGLAICRELVERGARVLGCATNVEELEKMDKEFREANSLSLGILNWYKCDMSNETDVCYMLNDLLHKYKRIHICINNAVCLSNSSLVDGETVDWTKMIEVNVLTAYLIMRVAAYMMNQGGQIIQMGSITAHEILNLEGGSNTSTAKLNFYHATESMIRNLTESLGQEVKEMRIRVSTISTGSVESGLLAGATGEAAAANYFEAHKCLKPEDVVSAVMHILLTPEHAKVCNIIMEPRASQVGLRWNCSLI